MRRREACREKQENCKEFKTDDQTLGYSQAHCLYNCYVTRKVYLNSIAVSWATIAPDMDTME